MYYSSLSSSSGPIKWNHNQESSLLQDVSPFSPVYDGRSTTLTLNERIRELYLQFLWLPESVMPLNQFVNMVQLLARHHSTTATTASPDNDDDDDVPVHPLHVALDGGILLTGKWCSYKYQDQLPNFFISHASYKKDLDLDLEASIMLFVLERHALCPGPSKEPVQQNSLDDKKRWLSEIEKREVKIQILLHLLKLSLPGECPSVPVRPIPVPSHSQKRRRVQPSSDDEEDNTHRRILEDRLEGLMDKLVLWQLALSDAEIGADGTKPVRDWTQIFCDDVVQPAFAQILPDQYKLLRRKLFRIPQWTSDSDSGSDTDAYNNNNNKPVQPTKPLLLDNNSHANTNANATHSAVQSRSRSLSVSLEQEAGLRRTESKPRRVLQREVSMSKVFKGRRNDGRNVPPGPPVKVEAEVAASSSSTTTQTHPMKGPIVLVEGTPQKPKAKIKIRAGA